MIQQELEIINKLGLHARASAKFTQLAAKFQSDVWLTRNGHGAGFWDRGALDARGLGDALSDHAKTFGTSDVYIGDDMRIHLT